MSALDYIKIRGFDGEPDEEGNPFFEMFQGIGSAADSAASPVAPTIIIKQDTTQSISDDPDASEALWAAQSAIIEDESRYLGELNEIFKSKQAALPQKQNIWLELLAEIAELAVGKISYLLILAKTGNPIVAEFASFALEVAVEKSIEGLRTFFQEGQELCASLITENAVFLGLENSLNNYELRREALKLHTEQIENVLLHISTLERQLIDGLAGEEAGTGDDWDKWIEQMGDSTEEVEKWLEQAFAAADVNYDDDPNTDALEIPATPNLPALPPTTDPKLIALSLLMRFGTKVVVELLKNWIENDHGKNHEEMLRAVKDLKYNDEMLDLGGVRVWHKAKVIEYGSD